MADFAKQKAPLDALEVRVVGLSSDTRDAAQRTVESLDLEFPVLYDLDPVATSRLVGCYTGTHDGKPHVQPASFVLDAAGTLVHAAYSSGKVGRLTAEDALILARDLRKAQEKGAGVE